MVDPMHFEALAEDYAAARPPYPEALWAHLRSRGLLRPGRTVLDIGAGTGQATGPLLEAGLKVTALEPGPRLAALLHAAHPAAQVIVSRAEDARLPAQAFDLVVAATSIHWLDLDRTLPKIASTLKPTGRFVVWRNVFGDEEAVVTPFRERVANVVRARSSPPRQGPSAEDREAMIDALTASGLFTVEDAATFRWSIELDSAGIGRLFRTFSDWSAPEAQQAADAVKDLGGTVTEHYTSWLLVLAPVQSHRDRRDEQPATDGVALGTERAATEGPWAGPAGTPNDAREKLDR